MTKNSILEVQKLRIRAHRNTSGLTIAEGYPEVKRAFDAGVAIKKLFVCPEIIELDSNDFPNIEVCEISKDDFAEIAFGGKLKGILAICDPKKESLQDLALNDKSILLVVESVEKPGNLGTMIRMADGAGIDGVIFCDSRTDIYNHNIARSSIGTVFSVPTVAATTDETIAFLKEKGIKIFGASAKATHLYTDSDLSQGAAIVVGNEHEGISSAWIEAADELIKIPMHGVSPCLNAAMSASIIIYEAIRQKNAV